MSRSVWAWSESSAALRAVGRVWKQSAGEVRADLGGWLRFGRLSATRCLVMLMAAGLVWMGAVAAPALAASSRGSGPGSSSERVTPVGVLGVGSGCAGGSARVRGLQRRLVEVGFSPGPVDGCYGPRTEEAVVRFQAARGLRVDGIVGRFTLAALRRAPTVLYPGEGYTAQGSAQVRALQRGLTHAGFSSGPIDGRYGPRTERAVARFQAARGLRVDGIAGPQTFAGMKKAQAQAQVVRGRSAQRAAGPRTRAHGTSQGSQSLARSRRRPVPPVHHPQPRNRSGSLSTALLVALVLLGAATVGIGAWMIRRRGRATGEAPARRGADQRTQLPAGSSVAPGAQAAVSEPWQTVPRVDPDAMVTEAAYREADERGDAGAASNLGVLFERRGDQAGAEGAYRRADERGDVNGAFNLGGMLAERGELAGAEAAYRRAEERGHPTAASNLGVLLERRGDLAGAEAAYRRADARGDVNGAFNLGGLLADRGDLAGAVAAYRRAEERGDRRAALNVGVLLEHVGDLAGAEAAYRRAGARGDAEAMFNHGVLLEKQGLLDHALALYDQVRRLGDPEIAEKARARERALAGRVSRPAANTATTGGRS
jgi:peptidoglycan hydrolase-like protein with peptidoglycan-binding domain/TPR repeat protein